MHLNDLYLILLGALLASTPSWLLVALETYTVLGCKNLVMVILCHRPTLIILLVALTKAAQRPVTFDFRLQAIPCPLSRHRQCNRFLSAPKLIVLRRIIDLLEKLRSHLPLVCESLRHKVLIGLRLGSEPKFLWYSLPLACLWGDAFQLELLNLWLSLVLLAIFDLQDILVLLRIMVLMPKQMVNIRIRPFLLQNLMTRRHHLLVKSFILKLI